MPTLDVYTSLVAILLVGLCGGLVGQLLRLPRIVPMILFGIALYPSLHPSIFFVGSAPTTAPPAAVSGWSASGGPQNPASSIRTFALLVALMRGGLSVKSAYVREFALPVALFATVPYFCELIVEALLAPFFLPSYYGSEVKGPGVPPAAAGLPVPMLAAFESASVWAPLSPSIVVPNMLSFIENGLADAGRFVLVGAPLEVSTALVTEGVMDGVSTASASGDPSSTVLGHIPVLLICSVLYGLAFALGFYAFVRARSAERVVRAIGTAAPAEPFLAFIAICLLCYSTSIDSVNTPWLVGFFSALCCAIATQFLQPALADDFCDHLKPAWFFVEALLFVLTGCVIRPAIDSGLSAPLFGNFLALLIVGSLARMVADVGVAVMWQWALLKSAPTAWTRGEWTDAARRLAFLWTVTIPKATLQASLGPKVAATFSTLVKTGGQPAYYGPSVFVAPSAAVAILYTATIGSVLTHSVGHALATHLQNHADAAAIGTELPAASKVVTPVDFDATVEIKVGSTAEGLRRFVTV